MALKLSAKSFDRSSPLSIFFTVSFFVFAFTVSAANAGANFCSRLNVGISLMFSCCQLRCLVYNLGLVLIRLVCHTERIEEIFTLLPVTGIIS